MWAAPPETKAPSPLRSAGALHNASANRGPKGRHLCRNHRVHFVQPRRGGIGFIKFLTRLTTNNAAPMGLFHVADRGPTKMPSLTGLPTLANARRLIQSCCLSVFAGQNLPSAVLPPASTNCGARLCPKDQPQHFRRVGGMVNRPASGAWGRRCGWSSTQPRSVRPPAHSAARPRTIRQLKRRGDRVPGAPRFTTSACRGG